MMIVFIFLLFILSFLLFLKGINVIKRGWKIQKEGSGLNKIAMESNDNKMPVYRPRHIVTSPEHFAFINWNQVNNFNFCDIYEAPVIHKDKTIGYRYYSEGDILIEKGYDISTRSFKYLVLSLITGLTGCLLLL